MDCLVVLGGSGLTLMRKDVELTWFKLFYRGELGMHTTIEEARIELEQVMRTVFKSSSLHNLNLRIRSRCSVYHTRHLSIYMLRPQAFPAKLPMQQIENFCLDATLK